jgi:hypothetical protein
LLIVCFSATAQSKQVRNLADPATGIGVSDAGVLDYDDDWTSSDFVGVVFDEITKKIYLLDASIEGIWRHSWDGKGNLPASGWTFWAPRNDIPELNGAGAYRYVFEVFDKPCRVGLLAFKKERLLASDSDRVFVSGPVGNLTVRRVSEFDPDRAFLTNRLSPTEGGSSVEVIAAVDDETLELLKASTGVVLGSAQVLPGQDRVTIQSIRLNASVVTALPRFFLVVFASGCAPFGKYGFGFSGFQKPGWRVHGSFTCCTDLLWWRFEHCLSGSCDWE